MFKKIVISDMIAVFVDGVWNDYTTYNGLTLIIAAFAFSIQIYCDFGGYSDIARGSARLLGIDLMINFNAPYLSPSFKEFWNRWHISLSSWFRDYLYFPLGGSKKGYSRKLANLMIIFLVSGLWHGAAYTFIIWGMIHGGLRVFEDLITRKDYLTESCSKVIMSFRTLGVFIAVTFAWIFFRAEGIHTAFGYLAGMHDLSLHTAYNEMKIIVQQGLPLITDSVGNNRSHIIWILIVFIATVILFVSDMIKVVNKDYTEDKMFAQLAGPVRWFMYYAMICICIYSYVLLTNEYGQAGAFLYFQF